MRAFRSALCSSVAVLLLAGSAWAIELPAEFLSQYEPAETKLADAYTHATLHGSYRLSFPQHGGLARTFDFLFSIDGEQQNLDETNFFGYRDGKLDGDGTPLARSYRITDRQAQFREAGQAWEDQTEKGWVPSYIDSVTQLSHVEGRNLLRWLRDPKNTIDSVEEILQDGRPITRVTCHWETEGRNGKTFNSQAHYDLSPTEGWGLRDLVIDDSWPACDPASADSTEKYEPTRFTVHVDYSGLRDGLPLVKQIVVAFVRGADLKINQLQEVEISEIEFGKSIDAEATPAPTVGESTAF